ncbi:response regulator [Deltaproteobacteria bacterium]|nr:response regulator [Deltaproteobacteria bacterium]
MNRPLRRVLCVDDDADILAVVSLALRTLGGLTVLVAGSGVEALSILKKEKVDLVLLDVMMPGMDGLQTLASIREDPLTAGLPVVLMTARVQLYEQSRPPPGVHAIIAKPFDPVSLASRLQAIWDRVEPG